MELYREAAEQGLARAQCNIGFFYYHGIAVEKDEKAAASWFAKGAEQGHPRSLYFLGECYEYGRGVGRNINRARELYQKASKNGYKKAEEALKRIEARLEAGEPENKEKPKKKRGFFGFGRK